MTSSRTLQAVGGAGVEVGDDVGVGRVDGVGRTRRVGEAEAAGGSVGDPPTGSSEGAPTGAVGTAGAVAAPDGLRDAAVPVPEVVGAGMTAATPAVWVGCPPGAVGPGSVGAPAAPPPLPPLRGPFASGAVRPGSGPSPAPGPEPASPHRPATPSPATSSAGTSLWPERAGRAWWDGAGAGLPRRRSGAAVGARRPDAGFGGAVVGGAVVGGGSGALLGAGLGASSGAGAGRAGTAGASGPTEGSFDDGTPHPAQLSAPFT